MELSGSRAHAGLTLIPSTASRVSACAVNFISLGGHVYFDHATATCVTTADHVDLIPMVTEYLFLISLFTWAVVKREITQLPSTL